LKALKYYEPDVTLQDTIQVIGYPGSIDDEKRVCPYVFNKDLEKDLKKDIE
jgi:hypothetical protein